MNRERRKQIAELIAKLEDIRTDVGHLREQEEGARDNLPDAVRGGGKGDAMDATVDALQEAGDALDAAVASLEDARA